MNILLNDIIQLSNAENTLKSPMLSDTTYINNQLTINLDNARRINSIGIGNVDYEELNIIDGGSADSIYLNYIDGGKADTIFNNSIGLPILIITFNDVNNTVYKLNYIGSGLYMLPKTIIVSIIKIQTTVKYIGRIGAGLAINIPTTFTKEPSFCSTSEPRFTLSGQVINGIGGYNFKMLSLDSRYRINSNAMNEMVNGYKYISKGYPFFIDLTDESYKLPYSKLYAIDTNQQNFGFESGINKYLYSRRFMFKECF